MCTCMYLGGSKFLIASMCIHLPSLMYMYISLSLIVVSSACTTENVTMFPPAYLKQGATPC